MHPKLKIIHQHSRFEKAETAWDIHAEKAKKSHPLKTLKTLPKMEGITKDTKKNLRLKAFTYLLTKDSSNMFFRYFIKHPLKYFSRLFKSYLQKKSYKRQGDFFLFNLQNTKEFEDLLKEENITFLLGFSYCHKPFECPSKRFSDECIHDPHNPICKQCFIGKCANLTKAKLLFIPTVHYIGEKIFEELKKNPKKKLTFLITACELSLEMFKDFGNMLNLQGIGVRLDGRICNTMKAFELSEKGIKPGLTVVLDKTQKEILKLLRVFHAKEKTLT